MTLQIAPGFTLPDNAVTETFGILGQRGSGKSTAAVVIAEEMWDAGLPWVAVDPKGDWWGVRSSADGKNPGLSLPVLGGLHGDVPLEATAGNVIAELVVDQNLTCVLDVSDFSKGDRARFLTAFFDRLYRRHRLDPQPRHVFLEEAHEYIPQMVGREEGRLKEAAARLVLQGRTFGLGVSVCSQRSARLHKDVLTQVGTLIAMRTPGALDRKAIEGWVTEHDVARELLASLPGLEPGEAWIWSPSFLRVAERIRFRRRRTFDSGSTPTVGKAARPPATLADVDLGAIKEAMAETIERAKADDPKALRRRIAELEKQIKAPPSPPEPVVEIREVPVEVEVPVLDEELIIRLEKAIEPVVALSVEIGERLGWEVTQRGEMLEYQRKLREPAQPPRDIPRAQKPPVLAALPVMERRKVSITDSRKVSTIDSTLPGPQRKLLAVLATYGPRTKQQLALQAGYSANGGGFNNPLGRLRSTGYVTGNPIEITPEGLAALGEYDPLPTGANLVDHWMGQLPGPCAKILAPLIDIWPQGYTKEALAAEAGYDPAGGGFNNPLGKLRTLGLVTRGPEISLTDEFGEAIS